MSSAGRSASPFDRASEGARGAAEAPRDGLVGGSRSRPKGPLAGRGISSTAPGPAGHLSTKVDDWLGLVEKRVDAAPLLAYRPTSAPLLRPANG
jgi:hypothetical protein